jgi:hypothetical protein
LLLGSINGGGAAAQTLERHPRHWIALMQLQDMAFEPRPERRRFRKPAIGPKALCRVEITDGIEERDREVLAFGQ